MPADESPLHRDRDRAESFGSIAEQYDRARPPYPDALIVDLLTRGPRDCLDVGCGTGKAARLLQARGLPVLGVEVDAGMAEIARQHGLDVEVAPFESWEDAGRHFDLIISAQAWHWVDPEVGAHKAARVLRAGGTIALFWNMEHTDPPVRAALTAAYGEVAPGLLRSGTGHGDRHSHRGPYQAHLTAAGFTDVVVRDYAWEHTYTRDEWLDLIQTYSDHHLLPDGQRDRLLAAVGAAIDGFGGSIDAHYETRAVVARSAS